MAARATTTASGTQKQGGRSGQAEAPIGLGHRSPPWNPDKHRPIQEPDCLYFGEWTNERDLLNLGGRLSQTFDTYFASGTSKATLVAGPYEGYASDITANASGLVTLPLDGLLALDQFTVEFWLKVPGSDFTALAYPGVGTEILSLASPDSSDRIEIFREAAGQIRASVRIDGANYFANDLVLSLGDIPADTWVPFSLVLDSTPQLILRCHAGTTRTSVNNTHGGNAGTSLPYRPWSSIEYGGGGFYLNGTGGTAQSGAWQVYLGRVLRWARTPNTSLAYKGPTVKLDTTTPATGTPTDLAGVFAQYPGWRDSTADGQTGGSGPGVSGTAIRDNLFSQQTKDGLKLVRVDHMLDKAVISGSYPSYVYDWSTTDTPMDALHAAGCDFHITLGYCPTPLQDGTHGKASVPSSNTNFAQICSDALHHLITEKGYRVRFVTLWNEPGGPSFWSGNFTQFAAMWAAVRTKLLADWPAYPLGGPEDGYSSTGYIKQLLDYCNTNSITSIGPLVHHDYTGNLWQMRKDMKSMKDYAASKGVTPSKVGIGEWNWSNAIPQQYEALTQTLGYIQPTPSTPGRDEHMAAYTFAYLAELLNVPADFAIFTRMGILDASFTGIEQYLGLFTNANPPRPLPVYAAFQAFWKLAGSRVSADSFSGGTANWPGIRTVATKDANGKIVLALGSYRKWNRSEIRNISLEYGGLPATFTWKLWRMDQRDTSDGRLNLIGQGDQASLPAGIDLGALGVACLEVTP